MNKKISMLAMSIITLVMMIAPMVGTAQACKWRCRTIEPYYVIYKQYPQQSYTYEEFFGDFRIRKGSVLQGPYDGPVGEGTMTAELLINIKNMVTEDEWTTFKNTLEITSGPYGAFTLVGFTKYKFEDNVRVSGRTFLCGESDLGFVWMSAEKGVIPGTGIYEDGWISHP